MFERPVEYHYQDPLDLIWLRAASDLGLKIDRSSEVFASYDGAGTLTITDATHFDADDNLAQMIFHEICHWLVAGPNGKQLPDWGLSNIDDRDLVIEYACHRLQAALSAPYGLRDFLAVTTDWRPYWDSLPDDPLKDDDDPAIAIAQEGFHRARLQPFEAILKRSLSATAAIADVARDVAPPSSLWSVTHAHHRLGSLLSSANDLRCGSCAWAVTDNSYEASSLRCRQHKSTEEIGPSIDSNELACQRWEAKFDEQDCGACGACCREGFDSVSIAEDDPFKKFHPDLVQLNNGEFIVPRPNGACIALGGDGQAENQYRCQHYSTRPKNCFDFEVAGDACLMARRRVGLSR